MKNLIQKSQPEFQNQEVQIQSTAKLKKYGYEKPYPRTLHPHNNQASLAQNADVIQPKQKEHLQSNKEVGHLLVTGLQICSRYQGDTAVKELHQVDLRTLKAVLHRIGALLECPMPIIES